MEQQDTYILCRRKDDKVNHSPDDGMGSSQYPIV